MSALGQEQAEIDQEARDSAKRIQLNQIKDQQMQIRQQEQQQQQREEQPQLQSYGIPTYYQ